MTHGADGPTGEADDGDQGTLPRWAGTMASSVANMLQLASAIRLAPWQMRDLDGHFGINVASLTFLFALFALIRFFVLGGGEVNLFVSGVLYAGAILALFVIGFIVRYFRTDEAESRRLTNRWSSFFIVSFAYCILILAALLVLQAAVLLMNGPRVLRRFADMFPTEWQALLTLGLLVAAVATALLWRRTHTGFPDFRDTRGLPLAAVLLIAFASVGTVFWLATFVL